MSTDVPESVVSLKSCPVCGSELTSSLRPWHLQCSQCSYEGSRLEPHIQDRRVEGDIDEEARETGLESLRRANFERLAKHLHRYRPPSGGTLSMLEVGCAHGWFLEANEGYYTLLGIEPDIAVAEKTAARSLPVRRGYFPDALDASETFDIIVFNDVIEHIPDINRVLASCRDRLNPEGLVVINAPSRRGALYRVARLAAKMGLPGAFDRLWQEGLPSPHVHYLDTATIGALARQHALIHEGTMSLPSVSATGLYERIRCAGGVSSIKAVALTASVMLAIPFLKLLPPDIQVWFLRKAEVRDDAYERV